jgi:hypothetical protein
MSDSDSDFDFTFISGAANKTQKKLTTVLAQEPQLVKPQLVDEDDVSTFPIRNRRRKIEEKKTEEKKEGSDVSGPSSPIISPGKDKTLFSLAFYQNWF